MVHRQLFIGYHGCEKSVAYDIITRRSPMEPSTNDYDWLGKGCYFWENDPVRALEFAKDIKHCNEPFVIGAVLSLGNCLDLTCREEEILLKTAYEIFIKDSIEKMSRRPQNTRGRYDEGDERALRYLDCAIINIFNKYIETNTDQKPYDSVRAAFWEGKEIANESFFMEKNHIQLCIRNYSCILGFFLPDGYSF